MIRDTKKTELRFETDVFSKGKNPPKNEDRVGYDATTIVLSDGATDKTGIRYEENKLTGEFKTGGEVVSKLIVDVVLASERSGQELVDELTKAVSSYYEKYNPKAMTDSAFKFAATMITARIVGTELVVTQVGDSSFRLNERDAYSNDKVIDAEMAAMRAEYIHRTGDIEGGRAVIMPYLKEQHRLQNNDQDPQGYGVINGQAVPSRFVQTFRFPLEDVMTIELVSDGYFGVFPSKANIDEYEKLHQHIEEVDPYKIKDYPSTKVSDDRTVLIAHLR